MSGYGAISPSDPASSEDERETQLVPKGFASFLEGGNDAAATGCQRETPTQRVVESSKIEFFVSAESIRFIAYLFFWGMCFFAIAMTKIYVRPYLLKGPEDGNTCPPFQISYNQDGSVAHDKSNGFDIDTNSHLQDAFGFGNICTNWDYSPSRELTAMVYPLFEYSLLLYIILDFCVTAVSYKKGYLSERFWTVHKIVFPFLLILCAWFRMIFVVEAYSNPQGHTAGFLGLQIALVVVAILNTGYVLETGTSYSFLGGVRGTRIAAYSFIIGDVIVSSIKMCLSSYIVFGWGMDGKYGDIYPQWALAQVTDTMVVGKVVDLFWMIFNAVLPVIISYIRSKSEPALKFTIDSGRPNIVG